MRSLRSPDASSAPSPRQRREVGLGRAGPGSRNRPEAGRIVDFAEAHGQSLKERGVPIGGARNRRITPSRRCSAPRRTRTRQAPARRGPASPASGARVHGPGADRLLGGRAVVVEGEPDVRRRAADHPGLGRELYPVGRGGQLRERLPQRGCAGRWFGDVRVQRLVEREQSGVGGDTGVRAGASGLARPPKSENFRRKGALSSLPVIIRTYVPVCDGTRRERGREQRHGAGGRAR